MCNVTLRRFLSIIVAVEKQYVLHILRVCVYRLRHPSRKAHAPSVVCLAVQYSSTLSLKRQDFPKTVTEQEMFEFFLEHFSKHFLL
jgi:hypothetical protein